MSESSEVVPPAAARHASICTLSSFDLFTRTEGSRLSSSLDSVPAVPSSPSKTVVPPVAPFPHSPVFSGLPALHLTVHRSVISMEASSQVGGPACLGTGPPSVILSDPCVRGGPAL